MKAIVIGLMFLLAGNVSAETDVCDFSTDYNIEINDERMIFSQTDGDKFEFISEQLRINGELAALNPAQVETSLQLQSEVRAMVANIAQIAIEGAELGLKAATIALSALSGDDEQMQRDLLEPIAAVSEKIKANISATHLNTETLEKSLDAAFDDELEQVVETAVTKYSGKILGGLMRSILSGDKEELNDLEFRMENLERDIETYVEANASALEDKANALCADLVRLDKLDDQMEAVRGYPQGGLFRATGGGSFKISNLMLDAGN